MTDPTILSKETDARFWQSTGFKPGQKLDMSLPEDRQMSKMWLEINRQVKADDAAGKLVTSDAITEANQPREWWLWRCAHTHNNYRLDGKVAAPIDYRYSISGRDQKRRIARGQVDAKLWICEFMNLSPASIWPYQFGAIAFWREIGTHPGEEPRMLTPPLFYFATVTTRLNECVRLLVQPATRRQRRPLSGVYVISSANRQGEPMQTTTPYENLDGRDADVDATAQVALDAFLETGNADPRFGADSFPSSPGLIRSANTNRGSRVADL